MAHSPHLVTALNSSPWTRDRACCTSSISIAPRAFLSRGGGYAQNIKVGLQHRNQIATFMVTCFARAFAVRVVATLACTYAHLRSTDPNTCLSKFLSADFSTDLSKDFRLQYRSQCRSQSSVQISLKVLVEIVVEISVQVSSTEVSPDLSRDLNAGFRTDVIRSQCSSESRSQVSTRSSV